MNISYTTRNPRNEVENAKGILDCMQKEMYARGALIPHKLATLEMQVTKELGNAGSAKPALMATDEDGTG